MNLENVIDLHIHSAPDVFPRRMDDIELAQAAAEAGMAAILIKSHHTLTADRAALVERRVDGVRVFGGLVLNRAVGGINPSAVETALSFGAKEIWMPTIDSTNHQHWADSTRPGISIIDSNGQLVTDIYPILELVAQAQVILGTGHLSPFEILALVQAAQKAGVQHILVTHPELPVVNMPIQMQIELASPSLYFERCLFSARTYGQCVTLSTIANAIRQVGFETTVLSTDFGQVDNPPPVEGMRVYLTGLLAEGLLPKQIGRMAKQNPAELLGIAYTT